MKERGREGGRCVILSASFALFVFPTPMVSSPSARLVDNIQACSSPTHDSALSKTKKPSETLRELGSAEPMFAVCKR